MDTTACEGYSATFTCVVFIPSGIFPSSPGWLRNGAAVDMMRHTVTNNLTGITTPVAISGTLTVSNVTVLDDDGLLYMCGIASNTSNATLNVVGKYIYHDLIFS